jgi:hypothetical protein
LGFSLSQWRTGFAGGFSTVVIGGNGVTDNDRPAATLPLITVRDRRGLHKGRSLLPLLLQTRTRVLDEEWENTFRR